MSKFLNVKTILAAGLLLAGTQIVTETMLPTWMAASAQSSDAKLGLGRTATDDEVAAWNIDVRPDGVGLPEGSGDVLTGEEIFADTCAVCHGDFGEAVGRWPVLAGGHDTLTDDRPVKTIGSYWPYLSTVFDYVNRAMPFGNAQSLEPDEVYAITAYLLYVNDLVEEDFELNHENFNDVKLPNEGNFYPDDRPEKELAVFTGEPCMENCKTDVAITMRAAVVDVTPEDAVARAVQQVAAATKEKKTTEVVVDAPALDAELVAAGEKVFKKCKSCHQVGDKAKNRTGPMLNGIFGTAAGSVEGFKYSNAFKDANAAGLTWNAGELAEFLTKPRTYIKGTKMTFAGLKKENDIIAVTEYLKSIPSN